MLMLAACIDAVIGVDTHRDTHHAEIVHPAGAVIATCSVRNTSAGYAQLLAWAAQHAPGLTSKTGIGPVSAAQAIVSFPHPGRCRLPGQPTLVSR
jgi:transposase